MSKVAGKIMEKFESEGFELLGARLLKMTKEEACRFYIEHKDRDFYSSLTDFISSNPCLVTVWGADEAIKRSRGIIGGTDPAGAAAGTIRRMWAGDTRHNVVHGSDSPESAAREIEFFFSGGKGLYSWEPKDYRME